MPFPMKFSVRFCYFTSVTLGSNRMPVAQAMELVDVMAKEGIRHDDATWHTLLSAAKHLAQPVQAEMVRAISPPRRSAACLFLVEISW